MSPIVQHRVQGHIIQQRREDGYIDATAMCHAAGRDFYDYERLKSTKAFLREFSLKPGIPGFRPIQKVSEGFPARKRTWVHPEVAMDLGQWISPKFKVRITSIVMDWMAALPRHQAFDKYLLEAPSDWKKRFQDEIWPEICRLKGIAWIGETNKRPQWFGDIINDIVYDRIGPPGLREELDNRNPRRASGHRARKHHQLLVDTIGIGELLKHLHAVLMLMRAAEDGAWGVFYSNLNRALQRAGGIAHPELPKTRRPLPEQLMLPFPEKG